VEEASLLVIDQYIMKAKEGEAVGAGRPMSFMTYVNQAKMVKSIVFIGWLGGCAILWAR